MNRAQSTPPTLRRTVKGAGLWAVGGAVGLGLLLSGCAGTTPAGSDSGAASSAVATSTAAASAPATNTAAPSAPASAAPSEAPSVAEPALCTVSSLSGAINDAGGAGAGSVFLSLAVTNTSAVPCLLDGYPGVSLVVDGSSTPLGDPAVRDPAAPSAGAITLQPGQSAAAPLRYTQAGNFQDCSQTPADAVQIYPPGDFGALLVAYPLTACSNPGIPLLRIGAFAA